MSTWFEGSSEIAVGYHDVRRAVEDAAAHYAGIVRLMPGITEAEVVERSPEAVTIRTNEGLMRRTNIRTAVSDEMIRLECDEVYEAGSKVTASSHFRDEFLPGDGTVEHHLLISDVEAPGLLGFLYRHFASRNIGKGFLDATAAHLEGDG